MTLYFSCL